MKWWCPPSWGYIVHSTKLLVDCSIHAGTPCRSKVESFFLLLSLPLVYIALSRKWTVWYRNIREEEPAFFTRNMFSWATLKSLFSPLQLLLLLSSPSLSNKPLSYWLYNFVLLLWIFFIIIIIIRSWASKLDILFIEKCWKQLLLQGTF